ncbi:DUF2235 domain-containing protein [Mycobacterium sp. URHB0044]|uniref:T6SS phospholipase effector Tle1-like catalytic domain-containing protein n=1 Tax=Mycobacterium sp. URHB0044 TaxID=1380386 RepID=UPI00048F5581|nr:DUF2235 domain-containing protein [Mycobacterium sp. URHB0044]
MKNVVLCFDQIRHQPGTGGDTNATALFGLLEQSDDQVGWHHTGTPRRARQRDAVAEARATIGDGYAFVVRNFEPGDRLLVFGAGRGGFCAQALTRLLGTVGILPSRWHELVDYVVSAYGLPRTRRTAPEWARVTRLATELNSGREPAIPVAYLGLWDALRPSALPTPPTAPVHNVVAGRHAVAVDGGSFGHRSVRVPSDRVEQVWFRGGHRDVAGGAGACEPLARIALDWILDGAVAAGGLLGADETAVPSAPSQTDALAGSARNLPLRRLPVDAHVHASVDVYLRAHPEYWGRLPERIVWSDQDWLARGERLVASTAAPAGMPAELADVAS